MTKEQFDSIGKSIKNKFPIYESNNTRKDIEFLFNRIFDYTRRKLNDSDYHIRFVYIIDDYVLYPYIQELNSFNNQFKWFMVLDRFYEFNKGYIITNKDQDFSKTEINNLNTDKFCQSIYKTIAISHLPIYKLFPELLKHLDLIMDDISEKDIPLTTITNELFMLIKNFNDGKSNIFFMKFHDYNKK